MDISHRLPYGMRRIRRRHAGETGLVVYGWYNRIRGWESPGDWMGVTVLVDGVFKEVVQQLDRGPFWIGLLPGPHVVEFAGGREPLRVEHVVLRPGEAVLIAFKPQERLPFMRSITKEQWAVRRLWPERVE